MDTYIDKIHNNNSVKAVIFKRTFPPTFFLFVYYFKNFLQNSPTIHRVESFNSLPNLHPLIYQRNCLHDRVALHMYFLRGFEHLKKKTARV